MRGQGASAAAVRLLLEAGTDVEVVNVKGETALQTAIEAGQDELALLLLQHKADPNHTSPCATPPAVHSLPHCC